MSQARMRLPFRSDLFLVAALCVACGGGRSSAWQEPDETSSTGGSTADTPSAGGVPVGGRSTSTSVATGGGPRLHMGGFGGYIASTGGQNTGGYTSTGGFRSPGGFPGFGGQSFGGKATGGQSSGGYYASGGYGIGGNTTGGTWTGGTWTGGTGGMTTAGRVGTAGGAFVVAGRAGMAGAAGATGDPSCVPMRTGVNATGVAGAGSTNDWYVDAQNGSDVGPGTRAQPLKTLRCASSAAMTGDTVYLLDGTWNASVDAHLGRSSSLDCGVESGIAFAPSVALRAVNPGAARVVNGGSHGLCLSGGVVEGLRLECASAGGPVLETRQGVLEIRGSTLGHCGIYGLNVSGNARVTMSAGDSKTYTEGENSSFAFVHEQGQLTINGGSLTFAGAALQLEDSAQLSLHGTTITSQSPLVQAGIAVLLASGAPAVVIDGDAVFDNVAVAVSVSTESASITVDGMIFTNGANAIQANLSSTTETSRFAINRLSVIDSSGFGIGVSGRLDLSVTNSEFVRCNAPSIMPAGSGTVNLDKVIVTGGWGGPIFSSNESSDGYWVKVRNLKTTGGQYSGPIVLGYLGDSFDFGTASSPGNNTFTGNNTVARTGAANFIFTVPAGMIVQAVGNTWDANQQGADAAGHYSPPAPGTPLDLAFGNGPNVSSGTTNAGVIRLAEDLPAGG